MAKVQGQVKQNSSGRRERRRMETREKIFRTAMQLFAERGFFQTTTEDITEAADVGQGTFFNYFPTKQHVFTVLSEKQMEKVKAAKHEAEAGKLSIHEVLHGLMHRIAEEPGRTQALARSLIAAFISNDQVREMLRNTLGRGRESLAGIIELGQKRGEIRRDRKAADLALAFQRNTLGTLLLWAIHPGAHLHEWLERTFEDFWAGIESRPQAIGNRPQENHKREKVTGNSKSKTPLKDRGTE
jgi:AcrR family transcriptional regulator